MASAREYEGLDYFRIIAAFLVVAIHTGPFASVSEGLDYVITYCIGRIGVPFFLMVTGYFVLSAYDSENYPCRIRKTVVKLAVIYLAVTVLYLPLNWYAGNLPHTAGEALKEIFFDGTFYHLWYLPGAIIGCLITAALFHYFTPPITGAVALILYLAGVFGDSWYGLAAGVPPIKAAYDGIFLISSYTRNGVFLAPVFLWMGAMLAKYRINRSRRQIWLGFFLSLAFMLAEGCITKSLGWQRHNSMYFFLLPVMLFLFEALRRIRPHMGKGRKRRWPKLHRAARPAALYIYLLHPLSIVIIRGFAGAIKQKELMVEQTVLFYLEVCVLTLILAVGCMYIQYFIKKQVRRLRKKD